MLGTTTTSCRSRRAHHAWWGLARVLTPATGLRAWEPTMTAAYQLARREGSSILFFALVFALTLLF